MEFRKLIMEILKDKDLKEQFLKNPKAVLESKFQIKVPNNVELKLLEDTENLKHLIIPYANVNELSDQELEAIAGGGFFDDLAQGWSDLISGRSSDRKAQMTKEVLTGKRPGGDFTAG